MVREADGETRAAGASAFDAVRRALRRLSGSIISAFAGWSAGMILMSGFEIYRLWRCPWMPRGRGEPWMFLHFVGLISAVFVFTTWAVALVPLYFLVPARSYLWKWPVCTACGALAGPGLLMAWHFVFEPGSHARPGLLVYVAAMIGGVTCFTGALTRARFDRDPRVSGGKR